MSLLDNARIRSKYFAVRFSLADGQTNYNVDTNHALFKSSNQGESANYSATRGSDNGVRYNVRITNEDSPITVKFNSSANDPIYIDAGETYEEFNIAATNLFLTNSSGLASNVRIRVA